jgi:DNA invertase Pin-like site-specific DNA recombinase
MPSVAEWQDLMEVTQGVTLATVEHPDHNSHGRHIKLGQQAKGKGGRPAKTQPGAKKQRREELMPRVLRMHKQGNSFGEIARKLGIAKSTIARWLS